MDTAADMCALVEFRKDYIKINWNWTETLGYENYEIIEMINKTLIEYGHKEKFHYLKNNEGRRLEKCSVKDGTYKYIE